MGIVVPGMPLLLRVIIAYREITASKDSRRSLVASSYLNSSFKEFKNTRQRASSSQPVSLARMQKSTKKAATLLLPCFRLTNFCASISRLTPLSKTPLNLGRNSEKITLTSDLKTACSQFRALPRNKLTLNSIVEPSVALS